MKTKALKSFLFATLFISLHVGAEGLNTFACLRDMMPLTNHGIYQKHRKGVEKPFIVGTKYIVFPEVIARKLSGFYVYDQDGAYYYDTIESRTGEGAKSLPIAGLELANERPLYQMVAQPTGLETVTIYYMPGFSAGETNFNGPVALGTAVLPVIGALLSRPEQYDYVYQSPKEVPDNRLQAWMKKETGGRSPASAAPPKIDRKIVSLMTFKKKDESAVWHPIKEELRLRREWVKSHNIDNRTFKALTRVLETTCKESGAQMRSTVSPF